MINRLQYTVGKQWSVVDDTIRIRGVTRHLARETRLGPRDETSRETYDVICTLLIINTNVIKHVNNYGYNNYV